MKRRLFIKKAAAISTLAPALGFIPSFASKTHLISFSFDDGFRKSFIKLAEIHEQYGLKILKLHGLDDEGWGPLSPEYFIDLLERLVVINKLDVIPVGMALEKYAS